MRRFWTTTKLMLVILIAVMCFVAPANHAQDKDPRYTYRFGCPAEEEYNYCPERYDSLQANKDNYRKGEEVRIVLSDLRDFEYLVEKVEIYLEPMFEYGFDLVYVEKEVGPIPRENDRWVWTWDQTNMNGKQVEAGRLYVRITLNCCRNYRDYFNIKRKGGTAEVPQVSPPAEEKEEKEVIEIPSSPSRLTTEASSPTQITITWQDNSDNEDGFRIYRNGSRIATVDPNVTSYTDTGLQPGRDYSYQVAAYNSAGESNLSQQLSSKTSRSIPSSPSRLTTEASSPTQITITWQDNSDNEDGFRIYRNGSRIATVGSDVTSYTDTGVQPGRDYSYQVAAYNSAGESNLSQQLSSKTSRSIPSSPSRLTTEASSPTQITITWQDNSDNEDGFRIYRNGSRIATVDPNVTEYTHSNLNSETRYCYEIVAYNESGESETSNRNCAVTLKSIPLVPSSMSAQALSPTQIRISWQDNSDNEDGFRIYRNGSRIATVGPNVTSYTDTGLQPGRSYSYAVTSFNNSGESGVIRTIDLMTMETQPEEEKEPMKEEQPPVNQVQLLAGVGIVLMVMGYIYSEIGG